MQLSESLINHIQSNDVERLGIYSKSDQWGSFFHSNIPSVVQRIGPEHAKEISLLLPHNTNMLELAFYGLENDFGAEGAKWIAEAIKGNSTLQKLHLEFNCIGDEGAKWIADALKVNSSLEVIAFEFNDIGDEGAKWIAEAIKLNSALQVVNLHGNGIGPGGTKFIVDALKTNSTLKIINLENNCIEDEGAKMFAELIKLNSSLLEICIGENEIGDEGARWIGEAIKKNFSLQKIQISGFSNGDLSEQNFIGNEAVKWIAEGIRFNSTLQELIFSYDDDMNIAHIIDRIDYMLDENKLMKDRNDRKFICAFTEGQKNLVKLRFDKMMFKCLYYPMLGLALDVDDTDGPKLKKMKAN